jgi:hypothetical protein
MVLARGQRLARGLAGAAALAGLGLAARPAAAQAIKTNNYSIDLFQGPVLAPINVTALGGAYAAYAEGISGLVANAAAPAVRAPFSTSTFEYDGSGSISIPFKLFNNNDFEDTGRLDADYSDFLYGTLGGLLQYGPVGAGFNAELYRYTLTNTDGTATDVLLGKYHLLGAVRLLGDQLMIGGGARFATLTLTASDVKNATIFGAGPEVGVLIRPDWQSFRIGATFRSAVDGGQLIGSIHTTNAAGVEYAGGLVVPNNVVLPWELETGVVVQVGPRPLNPAWIDPRGRKDQVHVEIARHRARRLADHRAELADLADPVARAVRAAELAVVEAADREADLAAEKLALAVIERADRARYENWPREHLLFTAELLITGPVANGVSIERFLGQNQPPNPAQDGYTCDVGATLAQCPNAIGSSGAGVNFSPRFGIETEPIPGLSHTWVGSYYEPSRFDTPVGRQHFTFGADLRLFPTTWWGLVNEVVYKLQASMDFAPRYQSASLGIGVWH